MESTESHKTGFSDVIIHQSPSLASPVHRSGVAQNVDALSEPEGLLERAEM
jgi:hypothetical protein